MKRLIGATAICSLLGGTVLFAAAPDQGTNERAKHARHEASTSEDHGEDVVAASVHAAFGKADVSASSLRCRRGTAAARSTATR
jgi:hypothetical protein